MKIPQILITGVLGDKISEDIFELLGNNFSLLVCSKNVKNNIEEQGRANLIPRWISFTPLNDCFQNIKNAVSEGPVIIITSGDPLFFGFGNTIKNHFPEMDIEFIPAISSMQACFSKFGIPWNKAEFISLHGRSIKNIICHLNKELLFVLTDSNNSPDTISGHIISVVCEKKQSEYIVFVCEQLGTSEEKCFSGSLAETKERRFSQPNCMIIKNKQCSKKKYPFRFGLKEEDIQHSRGLITKNEVRAAVIHSLSLPEKGNFWDIGSGSGSISIEVSRMFSGLSVYAIEEKEEQVTHIIKNKKHFECHNLNIIQGRAPEILKDLPTPDCVFIGGSSGNMDLIIEYLSKVSIDSLRLVINGVTEKTCTETPAILAKYGFSYETSILSVKRVYSKNGIEKMETFNTINIIRAEKVND